MKTNKQIQTKEPNQKVYKLFNTIKTMETLQQIKQRLKKEFWFIGYYEQGIKRYKVTDLKERKVLKFNSLEELKTAFQDPKLKRGLKK